MIQQRVVSEYRVELVRSKQDGYVSRYDEYDFDAGDYEDSPPPREPRPSRTGERIHVSEGPQRSPAGPHAPPSLQPDPQQAAHSTANEPSPPSSSQQETNEAERGGFGNGIFD
jgi:hypothetical protein